MGDRGDRKEKGHREHRGHRGQGQGKWDTGDTELAGSTVLKHDIKPKMDEMSNS